MDTGFQQFDSTLRCFVEAISQGQVNFQDLLASNHNSIVKVVKAEFTVQNAAATVIASEVKKTQAMIKETSLEASAGEQRQRLLRSLKHDTMGERLGQVKAAIEGTCRWMIQGIQSAPSSENLTPVCPHRTTHEKNLLWSCFPCWLESPKDKIYWVQGKAGSGKSTLMKFLATNPTLWNSPRQADGQDPLILSHFLWAAGSPHQKSLRGILLNLLYQLLSNDEHALDYVIDTFPDLKLKDFWGDWTLEDLERTMMDSLHAIATRPVFIFLDGLDEFGSSNASVDDDPRDLLDLVARLSTLDNVKMCVSSRPEPVFKNKLSGLCSLRLQDLTRSDMEKYAKAELLSNEVVGLENQKEYQELVNKLCNMADGVFLWTALAVRSLSRGLTNEDDISELYARLEKMPRGLYPLYRDMWERLNEDQHLYMKEAALYFQLVIHWWRMPSHSFDKRCTTFHLLASLRPTISLAYLNHDTASFPSDLEAMCERLGKRVEIRSAGLLELGDYGRIDFIHRSALEFLTDTPEGQQIMAHDTSTFSELRLWLLQADVARAHLMAMKSVESHISRNGDIVHPDGSNLYAEELVEDVHFNWVDSALPGDVQIMLLEACRRIREVNTRYTKERALDFAGSYALCGYHNLVIPFVRYPQFSPHMDVIRSRPYLIYLFITSSLRLFPLLEPKTAYLYDILFPLLFKAKVGEAILAEHPLFEFSEDVSSATREGCFSNDSGGQISAANERTAVLLLLAALTSLSCFGIEQTKQFAHLEILSKPRKYVENFFQRYPHNEEKVLLQIWKNSSRDMNWLIDIEFLGRRSRRIAELVVIECDTAYAAELLTLGQARQGEADTGENKAATVTDQDTIWRRAAGLKKTNPRVLVVGMKDKPRMHKGGIGATTSGVLELESVTYDEANRVLSALENICLARIETSFLIPGLQDSLNEIWGRGNPLTEEEYQKLADANSFNNFASEFMRGFKYLTCSASHLPWLAEYWRKKKVQDPFVEDDWCMLV